MIEHAVPKAKTGIFEGGVQPEVHALYYVDTEHGRHTRALHSHEDALELAYMYEGRGLYMIGDTTYEVGAGDVLIFNEGVLHAEQAHPEWQGEFGYFCLSLHGVHIAGMPRNTLLSDEFVPLLHLNEAEGAHIRALYEILLAEILRGEAGETCQSLAVAILLMVRSLLDKAEPMQVDETDELPRRVKAYLDAHYLEELTLAGVAEALGISPYYMGRRFKAYTGVSPMQYVTNRRIGLAQTYLQETTLPVIRIAELSGYENGNYFNALFKKNIGMTPGIYRQFIKFSGFHK